MQNARFVNARHQLSERDGQCLTHTRLARLRESRQDCREEKVKRNAIIEALRDENALPRTDAGLLLGQGKRCDRGDTPARGGDDAVELDSRLAGPNKLPPP